jgi:hypothetical protein
MQNNLANSTADGTGNHIKFSQPATYCITFEGHLDDKWLDRLGGMTITKSSYKEQSSLTTLVGRVRDQAELFGVLNTLYELHMPLHSVEILPHD